LLAAGRTVIQPSLGIDWSSPNRSFCALQAKDLNDRFGAGSEGLRVLTFLRSDIYDGLRFDDKDKHRPLEEHILWDPDGLREMLSKRLPEQIDADDLFEPGDMRGSIKPFNYIVKRTFLRPREILQFVELALKEAGIDKTEVSKDAIRSAELLYSRWKVEDLKQEFSKVSPDFGTLLEGLRQELHRYESMRTSPTCLRGRLGKSTHGSAHDALWRSSSMHR
jgi:hypothetical protein